VHAALIKALDFWMDIGVDAFRLDAIPYLYEREGTTCENLPETHDYLKTLRTHIDEHHPGRMLLAEANQWPEDSLPYFGDGDECHMAFHFPVMPRMYMAVAQEDRFPIIDIMAQTPAIPPNCQWAMFLRNHDELTLEMVTEEDRDYMWRTYANDRQARINLGIRRRLAPLMGNHRGRIHLMNGLLFSFPGTPIIYYGDEIGMGDNIYLGDRNGVRTPMQWSADRNAGFSRANPQRLFLPVIIDPQYHYEQVNIESQQNSPYSLLWWMKRLISTRKRYKAFGRGTMEFLHPENRKILAFVRRYEEETILVVANLSRLVQCFELDLSAYRGMVPVELSGGTHFPEIGERPYFLNLGPFAFYWFALEKVSKPEATNDVPLLDVRGKWNEVFASPALGQAIARYVRSRRWFGGKTRTITNVTVRDHVSLAPSVLALLTIEYTDAEADTYVLPLAITQGRRSDEKIDTLIARLKDGCMLYEPVNDESFAQALLAAIGRRPSRAFKELRGTGHLEAQVVRAEQSNTAFVYGQRLFVKLFRRLEAGENVDLEVSRFLNEETDFRNTPRLAGALEYRPDSSEPMTLAMAQAYTPNSGDAWTFTLDAIGRYFERVTSDTGAAEKVKARTTDADFARDVLGTYLPNAQLLGQRTAEMHLALASRDDIAAFAPEPFTPHYQRSIYQSTRTQIVQTLALLRRRAKENPDAQELLKHEADLQQRIRAILNIKIGGQRIRTHGDYHLGQVLYTGNDFVIIDFEGEPLRPLSERRIKRSALRDVAGMLRSFHYAPYAVFFGRTAGGVIRAEDAALLEAGAVFWHQWISAAFLSAYLERSSGARHLPSSREEINVLLNAHLLEKALYEIVYELNNRPEWVRIPLRGVVDLLRS
jgi:maltose alpha-D-glucosyltransferase/alpha-amylase